MSQNMKAMAALLGTALAAGWIGAATAGEPKVGDPAPEFSLQGSDGKVHALDAKVALDDNAKFRHPEWAELKGLEKIDARERDAAEKGLQYVGLEGNVGVIANGAGLAMATSSRTTWMRTLSQARKQPEARKPRESSRAAWKKCWGRGSKDRTLARTIPLLPVQAPRARNGIARLPQPPIWSAPSRTCRSFPTTWPMPLRISSWPCCITRPMAGGKYHWPTRSAV